MNDLRIWTDGEDWYIAESADQAVSVRREMCGDDADEIGPLELASDPLRMYGDVDDPQSKQTRPQAEWIADWIKGGGEVPSLFASSNF